GWNLWDYFDVILRGPTHQVGNFVLLKKSTITAIMVRGILLPVVQRTWRIISAAVVDVAGKLDPASIQLGMTVEAHASVHFNHHHIEFIKRYEIAQEALKEGNI